MLPSVTDILNATWLWPPLAWSLLAGSIGLTLWVLFWDRPGRGRRPKERCPDGPYDIADSMVNNTITDLVTRCVRFLTTIRDAEEAINRSTRDILDGVNIALKNRLSALGSQHG